jgi:hypothetical protein
VSNEPTPALRTTFWQRYVYVARYNWQHRPRVVKWNELVTFMMDELLNMLQGFFALVVATVTLLTTPLWWPVMTLYRVVWRAARVALFRATELEQKMHEDQAPEPRHPHTF